MKKLRQIAFINKTFELLISYNKNNKRFHENKPNNY